MKIKLLASFSILFLGDYAVGQIQMDLHEEPKKSYYSLINKRITKFSEMKDMRDVFHLDKYLMGKKRFIGDISYNTGRVLVDDGQKFLTEYRQAIAFFTRIRFYEEFSVNTTFYKDFNPRAHARWIADYTYSIGRYNWRPNRVNFGYENYINNKYSDSFKTFTDRFLEGYYFVSYNHVPEKLNKNIRIDSTSNLKLIYFVRYAFKYRNENDVTYGGFFNGKPTLGAAVRYSIFWNIYLESAVYFYFNPSRQKQPWDPDYTYGFGYFDWRAFRLSVTYGNWAINRFSWNKSFYPKYGFMDGNFRIIVNWMW